MVEFLIAENPKDLLSKLERSDVLYVAGGEAENIEPAYADLKNIGTKLSGKVFIGSSMGVFFASEQYVLSLERQDTKSVRKGLGLLPIQTLCHWNIEINKENKLRLLAKSSNSPIMVLDEFEFTIFYK